MNRTNEAAKAASAKQVNHATRVKVRSIAFIGLFGALSTVLMLLRFPLPFLPPFLSFDLSGVMEIMGEGYKVPHIGWNALHFPKDRAVSPLFRYIQEGDCVYFVHSFYAANCQAHTIATAEYGPELTAAAARDNIYGVQFHPEKSGQVGRNILKAFCEL